MGALSIRKLDDRVVQLLRMRAKAHGRSVEAEVRTILADAVLSRAEPRPREVTRLLEGLDVEDLRRAVIPARTPGRRPPPPDPIPYEGLPPSETVITERR